jgi:hypothetical protein
MANGYIPDSTGQPDSADEVSAHRRWIEQTARALAQEGLESDSEPDEGVDTLEDGEGLSNAARLEWRNLHPIVGSDGRRHLYYLVTGGPGGAPARFLLRVSNTNRVYNFQAPSLKIRLRSATARGGSRVIRLAGAAGDWKQVQSTEIPDESHRDIELTLSPQTLADAYDDQHPLCWLDVEYHWREGINAGQAYYNRTSLAFFLVAPIEYLFGQRRFLTEVHFNEARHRPDFWQRLTGVTFQRGMGAPSIQYTIRSSLTSQHAQSDATRSSTTRTRSDRRSTSRTVGFELGLEDSRGASASASIEIFEIGVERMMTASQRFRFEQTVERATETSVARQHAREITRSSSYAVANESTTQINIPLEVLDPGTAVTAYLYPVVRYDAIPVVRFEGPHASGQATARVPGRLPLAVPSVAGWQLTTWTEHVGAQDGEGGDAGEDCEDVRLPGQLDELDAGELADLFDRIAAGEESVAEALGLALVTGPGGALPEQLPAQSWMLTRALGEAKIGHLGRVRVTDPGRLEVAGVHADHGLRVDGWLPRDRMVVTTSHEQDLRTRCGFFGSGVQRTSLELRQAIVDRALDEWRTWHTQAGRPRRENEVAMFGHLVGYYLAANGGIRPDTVAQMWTRALSAEINYGALPGAASAVTLNAEVARVRTALLTNLPGSSVPANLATLVDDALRHANQAHRDSGPYSSWSSVWVSACVRYVAIQQGLEALVQGRHVGRDELLHAHFRHSVYALEAYRRRVGPNRRSGTYHAFRPDAIAPRLGDIIIQDRQATRETQLFRFAHMNALANGRETHGDIVVEVNTGNVVTVGGNLGGSVRKRRFPLDPQGRLVIDRRQLYAREADNGVLQAVPTTTQQAGLPVNSTARIFTLLTLQETCAAVLGQPYHGGILT